MSGEEEDMITTCAEEGTFLIKIEVFSCKRDFGMF